MLSSCNIIPVIQHATASLNYILLRCYCMLCATRTERQNRPKCLLHTILHCIIVTALHYNSTLYCTILYYKILYYTIPYCTILHHIILYYTVLCHTILCYTVLFYIILYYTVLYCTVLYCIILYCSTLYYTILNSTLQYNAMQYNTVLLYYPHSALCNTLQSASAHMYLHLISVIFSYTTFPLFSLAIHFRYFQ